MCGVYRIKKVEAVARPHLLAVRTFGAVGDPEGNPENCAQKEEDQPYFGL